ncbi:class 1 fructose-bisphosphatase [soil metagenome]
MNTETARASTERPIVTFQQHMLRERDRFPHATGEFSWLLSGLTLATKMIQNKVRHAGLTDILGAQGTANIQGEQQQKLDVYANDALLHCLSLRENIGLLASEEAENPIILHHGSAKAKYAVVFDPLDGSSNIDVNVGVGTIFSILRRPEGDAEKDESWLLQPGSAQVAAGYVLYGPSTMLVYTTGNGVHGFTLEPSIGAYVLSHPDIRMPQSGPYYSVNEANRDGFPEGYQEYLRRLTSGAAGRTYSSRYIGSLVGDFHRTLLKGGVYLYPPTKSHPNGKLRLLYECNPIAFLAEQAGGMATNGLQRLLDLKPESLHARSPFIVGSMKEMEEFKRCVSH